MVEQFVQLIRRYLALIDALSGLTPREFLIQCAILFPQIYSASHQLPDVELPEDDPLEGEATKRESPMGQIMTLLGKYDVYSEVFDPILEKEAIKTTLSNDLEEIYRDLKGPLVKYDSGDEPNERIAVWEWKFGMQTHWGHHLVAALHPIHSLVYDHLDPEYNSEEDDA